jgi:hypothetical protein
MSEFGDRSSQSYQETIEDVDCPICKKAKVRVSFVAGYMTWSVSRIAAGSKRTPYFHDPKVRPQSGCPACKATRKEIKDALERGRSHVSHEERLRRIREAGLPTVIETTSGTEGKTA